MATVTTLRPTDTTWTRTVHTVAAKARSTFPSLGGKIDHATALVLAGAVEQPDSFRPQHYSVASQSDPTGLKTYAVICGTPATCECQDYTRHGQAESSFQCKHILGVWIYRRALAQQEPAPAARVSTLPEAAFSLCLKGRLAGQDAQLTIRGSSYEEFAANVATVRGLLDAPVLAPAISPPASRARPCLQHRRRRRASGTGR